jgi:hypothetical protein
MSDIITVNGKEISLIKVNVNSRLTKGQETLLNAMYVCLKDNKPLNWDLMVEIYSKVNNYPKEVEERVFNRQMREMEWKMVHKDIVKIYKENGDDWIYGFKPKIRQWFATNIGSMVLKGSLLALPVIEID